MLYLYCVCFFFKQKTAYEMRISDWSSDVCSSDLREIGDAAQMGDAAGMDDGGADIVDQLVLDQLAAIPDGVEDLTDRERGHRMLADQAERLLILGGGRILQPEQPIGFERLAQSGRLDRRQAVVNVVKQLDLVTVRHAQPFEQFGRVVRSEENTYELQ